MTQPTEHQHCVYCAYRDAAGTLTIHQPAGTTTEPSCWTCAREAADYYTNRLGSRTRFQPNTP